MQDVKVPQFRSPEKSIDAGVVIFKIVLNLQIGGSFVLIWFFSYVCFSGGVETGAVTTPVVRWEATK